MAGALRKTMLYLGLAEDEHTEGEDNNQNSDELHSSLLVGFHHPGVLMRMALAR